jgi:putative ABC transport system permease protein
VAVVETSHMHTHTAHTPSPLRYALRSLGRSPGFVAAAVVSLGLALALNTTTFALLDAVRHPPIPYAHPERIARANFFGGGKDAPSLEDRTRAVRDGFHGYEAFSTFTLLMTHVQTATRVENEYVVAVDSGFFELLGVRPMVGRGFLTSDYGGGQSAVISFSLWERALAGRPLSSLQLDVGRGHYTVIGVMPRGVHFPFDADVWLPRASIVPGSAFRTLGPFPVLRLKPGVTREGARAELDVIAARLNLSSGSRLPLAARLSIGFGPGYREAFPSFFTLSAVVVLVIACANLGAMMLARGVARRRETAIRIALGASRRVVVRQVLLECGMLVASGAALGVLLTIWSLHVLPRVVTPYVPAIGDIQPTPSWRVFAFVLAVSAVMVFLGGAVPSARAAATDPAEPMKDGSGTITTRLRDRYNPLVVVEVALSTALLMACGMFVIYVMRLSSFEYRFAAKRLVVASMNATVKTTPDARDVERFYESLVERTRGLRGARAVATKHEGSAIGQVVLSEQGRAGERWMNLIGYSVVSADYLRALGLSIAQGRDFDRGDEAGASAVVVVDDSAARRLWPDVASPVGHMIKLGRKTSDAAWLRVVGVARSVSWRPRADWELPPDPSIYVVWPHDPTRERQLVVQSEDAGGAARTSLVLALQREISAFAPAGAAINVRPYLQSLEQQQSATELLAWLFAALGAFGLTLCAVGLYGILAYSVRRRLREYAVRIALGARSHDVVRLVVHDVAVTALAGIGAGAFFALWLTHSLSDAVHSVAYADAVALVCAEAVLLLVAAVACLGPLRQATTADPVEILRAT